MLTLAYFCVILTLKMTKTKIIIIVSYRIENYPIKKIIGGRKQWQDVRI